MDRRAALHAVLSDPARLRIVDTLSMSDAAPSELAHMLAMSSNLLAHHLRVLEAHELVTRTRSEGDRRRWYLRLRSDRLAEIAEPLGRTAPRVLFVCTANSARSQLAAALWRHSPSRVEAASGGTHPADRIHPGVIDVARRHRLPMRRLRPRLIDDVHVGGDLIITVCDRAHEELGTQADLHWSIPDPVRLRRRTAFDHAYAELTRRVNDLVPRLESRGSS